MALIKLGGLIAEARGSVGGAVFSRNAAGAYVRNKSIPINPNTPQQQAVRSRMTLLTNAWTGTLSQADRDLWDTYGENVPVPNRVGDMINISGIAWFISSNMSILQAGFPRVDPGPGDFTRAEQDPGLAITASEATQLITVTFPNEADWFDEDEAGLLIYGSRPQNETVIYFKGPYRYADVIPGDSITPITSPQDVASPFAFVENQRLFVRAKLVRADGRTSEPMDVTIVAGA